MRKIFVHAARVSYFDRLVDDFVFRRLSKLAKRGMQARHQRMAVFANDRIGNKINVFGVYEKEALDALFFFLKPLHGLFEQGVALDIGANVGNHSIYFSRYFSETLAFEPNPATFQLLRFNSIYARGIRPYNFGFGEQAGVVDLFEDSENSGASSTKYRLLEPGSVAVRIERLDDTGLLGSGVEFVKIDVEGAEAAVIRGAARTLSENQPLIVFEQHAVEFGRGEAETETIRLLRDLGYSICWSERKNRRMSWIRKKLGIFPEVLLGKDIGRVFLSGPRVPKATYSMLIAVPPRFKKKLGLE